MIPGFFPTCALYLKANTRNCRGGKHIPLKPREVYVWINENSISLQVEVICPKWHKLEAELLVLIHSLDSSSPKSLHQVAYLPVSTQNKTQVTEHTSSAPGSHLSPSGFSPTLHVTRKLPHISYFRCRAGNQYTLQNMQKILQLKFLKQRILSQISEGIKSSVLSQALP